MGKFFQPFPQELVLLLLEDIRNVELLQFLIGEVDKELLQGVD